MSNSWWAAKLAGQTPPAPSHPTPPIPLYPQHQPQASSPAVVQQQPQPRQAINPLDKQNGPKTFSEALSAGVPGPAGRLEGHLSCPNCGSATGYTQYSQMPGNRPRPHCYECGYNGHFSQGQEANWVV